MIMDQKTREISAIATSVAAHCQPCLKFHYGKAKELGIPKEDIVQIIELALKISDKGDEYMSKFADDVLQEK
jgi:AhpD family alkylhydroperoxidase